MTSNRKSLLLVLACIAFAFPLLAQPETHEFDVLAFAQDAFQLTPAAPAASRPILIDETSSFSLKVWAASRTLTVSIAGPDGSHHTIGDAPTADAQAVLLPIDSAKPGACYLFIVNNPAIGMWTLNVSEPASLAAPLDIIAITTIDNNRWLVLTGGGEDYPAGGNVTLALVAFDGATKVHSLSINARLFNPTDPLFPLTPVDFRDDGTGADEHAGDGIFEAFVNPGIAGRYQVQVDATATTATDSFRRTAAATLRVVPRNANITGFTDGGVDDNGDGLFERIGIKPSADINVAGTYLVFVRLHAANGADLQHTLEQPFAAGPAAPEIFFSADEIKKSFNVDGPYDVAEVRFMQLIDNDYKPADLRWALGTTAAYSMTQLQHAKLQLTSTNAIGDDWDADGLFDSLDVVLTVQVTDPGWYSFSAVLADATGKEIEYLGDSQYASAAGSYPMTLQFDGARLAQQNIDGPYRVLQIIVSGDYYGIMDRDGFTTGPFLASQFNGYAAASATVTKSFANAIVPLQGSTTMTLSIANPNETALLRFITLVDALPAGMTLGTGDVITTCRADYSSYFTDVSGAIHIRTTLEAGTSCSYTVPIKGIATGHWTNVTDKVTSIDSGTGGNASATLDVVAPPHIEKAFSAPTMPVGGTAVLTFTLSNEDSAVPLSDVAFVDDFPSGLVVDLPAVVEKQCSGAFAAAAGATSVSLSGATLTPGQTCTIKVHVSATSTGTKQNTTQPITSSNAGSGNAATASIDVNSCTYALSPPSISVGPLGTGGAVTVTTGPTCSWSAISNDGWLSSTSSGTGTGSLSYTIAPNLGVPMRQGTIRVGGQSFAVTQTGVAPSGLVATATTENSVTLTWISTPVNGVFEIYRNNGSGPALTLLPLTTTGTSFVDTTASTNTAYVYAVRAVDTSTNASPFTNHDLAVTKFFSDNPLVARTTIMKLDHLIEHRAVINLVRKSAALGDFLWADAAAPGLRVKADHYNELITALDAVWSPLGLPHYSTAAASPGAPITANEYNGLRGALK